MTSDGLESGLQSGWIQAVVAGITCFAATNLDDIVLLMLFFGQTSSSFRSRHIILGQYLGFTAIILASLPGFFGGLWISETWIGLLGFVPIAIGIHKLMQPKEDEYQVQAVSHEVSQPKTGLLGYLSHLMHPRIYSVAAVTLANGGDNIGIYVPLFAGSNLISLVIILAVFFVLVGLWCYIARQLTRHPAIAPLLTRYGEKVVPFVLIGLGIFILVENQSYRLLPF